MLTRDGEAFALRGNESAHAPQGARHRPRDFGEQAPDCIEIQVSDIKRA